MEDLFDPYPGEKRPKKDLWEQEWEEEVIRRKQLGISWEERQLSKKLRNEKKYGVRWQCDKCGASYSVKTPFNKLYCSECLSELSGERLLPKGKIGYWIFDDA